MLLKYISTLRTHNTSKLCTIFALLAITENACHAQRVEPMVFELTSSGNQSITSLRVNNNKSAPLTIEVEPSRITLDTQGNETRTLAEDDFLIYPPQTIIQPGKTQVVKVKYIGDPSIDASQAYRISVKQVPVDLGLGDTTGVGLLLNFNTLANVIPSKEKTSAELNIAKIEQGKEGNWIITITNTGNRFARLSQTTWTAFSTTDASKQKKFEKEEVNVMLGKKLILPNSTLRTTMTAIEGFSPESTNITIIQ